MAINEGITGSGVSTTVYPSSTVSDVIIEGTGSGKVLLQVLRPLSSTWITLNDQGGAFPLSTADPAVGYRFKAVNVVGTANVYLGP